MINQDPVFSLRPLFRSIRDQRMLAPLVVAALLRIGLMAVTFALTGTRVMTQGDTTSYLEPGRNLIMHGAFATAGGLPEIDRTPGYPFFAMLTGMIFGNVLLTVIAQIILSLISLLLVCRIADMVFPHRSAGLFAAWLFAVEPLSIVSTVRVMPETLFLLLLLIAIERLLAFEIAFQISFESPAKPAALVAAGISLAAATYVRPVACYLAFALAAGLAMTASARRSVQSNSWNWWKAPALLLISVLPWLAIWQIRNSVETGYSGFSSIVEKNLYFYQSAEVSAELQHISLGAQQVKLGYLDDATYLAIHPEQRDWSQFQKLHFMRTQSLKILSAHPGLYLRSHIAGVGVVAFTPCATELLQLVAAYPSGEAMPRRILNEGIVSSAKSVLTSHPGVAIAMTMLEAFLLLLYGLAICGFLSAGREKRGALTLAGIAIYFLLISGGAQAVGRYRAPVMPELCILAAGGLATFRRKETRGHESPADAAILELS